MSHGSLHVTRFCEHGWKIWLAPWIVDSWPGLDSLLASFRASDVKVLRDSNRSLVIQLPGLPQAPERVAVIAKQPRWHDRRPWIRLTTLWRKGEARQTFSAWLELNARHWPAPRPLAVLERRRLGMVSESWLLYEFVQGEPVREEHWPLVVNALRSLHGVGFCHRDPHLANWLIHQGEIRALDLNPKALHPLWGGYAVAFDYIRLRQCEPRTASLLPQRRGLCWRLAEARNSWHEWLARRKRRLRGQPD